MKSLCKHCKQSLTPPPPFSPDLTRPDFSRPPILPPCTPGSRLLQKEENCTNTRLHKHPTALDCDCTTRRSRSCTGTRRRRWPDASRGSSTPSVSCSHTSHAGTREITPFTLEGSWPRYANWRKRSEISRTLSLFLSLSFALTRPSLGPLTPTSPILARMSHTLPFAPPPPLASGIPCRSPSNSYAQARARVHAPTCARPPLSQIVGPSRDRPRSLPN